MAGKEEEQAKVGREKEANGRALRIQMGAARRARPKLCGRVQILQVDRRGVRDLRLWVEWAVNFEAGSSRELRAVRVATPILTH